MERDAVLWMWASKCAGEKRRIDEKFEEGWVGKKVEVR